MSNNTPDPAVGPSESSLRLSMLDALDGGHYDVFVVGGGINGAVSAAALASRGVKVGLAERGDFAGVTSQESSNLVWGGFKYLQNYELPLVFKLCRSRNKLMKAYPTGIKEVGFLATLDKTAPFPSWLAALGAFGYWGIGSFATRRPGYYSPKKLKKMEPVINITGANAAIDYADAYLPDNDARLVWSFVRTALDDGANAANYLDVVRLERTADGWTILLKDVISGRELVATARAIVNGAGPFVDGLNAAMDVSTEHRIVYSKGIHLVVPRLTESERVLAFFDDTQRLFYVIPMAHRSVIGTTDTRTTEPQSPVTDDDRNFLLEQINDRLDLETPLTVEHIIAERSGVRPLVVKAGDDSHNEVDWTSLSRKHEIEIDRKAGVVSIFGGKLTDCLNIGDEIIDAISDLGIPMKRQRNDTWFGEPSAAERNRFMSRAADVGLDRHPDVEFAESMAEVLWRRHGTQAHRVIDAIADQADLGDPVLADTDVLRGELPLFAEREMIVSPEDFLRRRTKVALIHRPEDLAADPGMAEIHHHFGQLTRP